MIDYAHVGEEKVAEEEHGEVGDCSSGEVRSDGRQRAGREGNAVIFARLLVGRTQKRDNDEATLPTLNLFVGLAFADGDEEER